MDAEERLDYISSIESSRAIRYAVIRTTFFDESLPKWWRVAFFAREVLGYVVLPCHEEILRNEYADGLERMSIAPRGIGKSTIGTEALSVAEIVWNPNIRILVASKTEGQSEAFVSGMKNHFERNATLRAVFGDFVDKRKWRATEFTVSRKTSTNREPTVTAVGIGGAVASRHYDLVIGDDLVDEENSATALQREKVRTWYLKVFLPTITDSTSRLRIRNTLFHPEDLIHELRKTIPTVAIPVFDDDGNSIWPDKYPTAFLEGIRRRLGSAIFNTQYMMSSEGMLGRIFKPEWIRYYRGDPIALDAVGEPRLVDDNGKTRPARAWEGFKHWIGCDFAAGDAEYRQKKSARALDWWTIVVLARLPALDEPGAFDERIWIRYAWRGRVTKAEYLARLRAIVSDLGLVDGPTRGLQEVCGEKAGQQEHLLSDMLRAGLPVRRVTRTKDKVSRAFAVQPFFENNQVLLPARDLWSSHGGFENWDAFVSELAGFPDGEHDDFVDGMEIAMARAMRPFGAFVV